MLATSTPLSILIWDQLSVNEACHNSNTQLPKSQVLIDHKNCLLLGHLPKWCYQLLIGVENEANERGSGPQYFQCLGSNDHTRQIGILTANPFVCVCVCKREGGRVGDPFVVVRIVRVNDRSTFLGSSSPH